MIESLSLRTLVIGNSGSGKSSLAGRLGVLVHVPIFDLDSIHWKGDGFGAKQDEDVARQRVADLAATQRWVIEGVYGWLAEVAVPRATALVWLDVSWDVCREGLIARGLLMTLLRGLGISSKPVLLQYGLRRTLDKFLPSPQLFDHVIVQVTLGEQVYYLDPTRLGQHGRLRSLGQVHEGTEMLVVAPDGRPSRITSPNARDLLHVDLTETASVPKPTPQRTGLTDLRNETSKYPILVAINLINCIATAKRMTP